MKIRIDLTKKDADIAAFKKSLPKGEWSKNVVQIMNAAMRDRVADIPMQFTIEALHENFAPREAGGEILRKVWVQKRQLFHRYQNRDPQVHPKELKNFVRKKILVSRNYGGI